jgi:VWFA-related protein
VTGLALVLALAGLWGGARGLAARAQDPQPPAPAPQPSSPSSQAPTFRTGVDRVTVDAIVVDDEGNQVSGLTAADFQLQVDGQPRAVESVEFIGVQDSAPGREEAPSGVNEAFPEVTVNGRSTAAGRLIVVVADAASYRAGEERPMVIAGVDFLRRLTRRDRVGLITLPTGQPTVDLTLDHDRVGKALTSVVGLNSAKQLDIFIGVHEAQQITRNDPSMLKFVVERECSGPKANRNNLPKEIEQSETFKACPTQVPIEAERILRQTSLESENKVRVLTKLVEGLSKIDGPKIVVLLSQGLMTTATASHDFTRLGEAAGRSGVSFYAIQIYQTGVSADADRTPTEFDFRQEQQLLSEGLRDVAFASGGTLIQAVGKIDHAFERVAREIAGRYVLSFNVEPDDRTGKPRKIELKMPKSSGRLLRYRREFVWRAPTDAPGATDSAPGGASGGASGGAADTAQLAAALGSGEARGDLALAAATFTSPDAEAPGQRTTLWVRVGQADVRPDTSSLLFEVLNEKNVRVASSQQNLQAKPGEPLDFVAKMPLPPGRYVLRLAARDGGGRLGTVEHPFEARLPAAGPPAVGSLLLLDARAMAAGRSVLLRVLGPQDSAFHGFVELQASAAFDWTGIKGTLEVLDAKDGAVRSSIPMRLRETKDPARRGLEASVPVSGWPVGTYRVRAAIMNGSAPLATPLRSVVLETVPPDAPEGALTSAAGPPPPASAHAVAAAGEAVERATVYLHNYLAQGSSVVAEERYVQILRPGPPKLNTQNDDEALEWRADNNDKQRDMRDAQRRRQMVSDMLMIKTRDGAWTNYRDVGVVDGRTLGNRSKRAIELFTEQGDDLGARLAKVADESSRYSLAQNGNFSMPSLPLMVLQPEQAPRFEFARQGEAVIDGIPTAIITYRETKAPSFIHNRIGGDVFVSGKLWVATGDGRVLRTEMQFSDRFSGWASHSIVSYRAAPSIGVLMPAEMWERHYHIDNFRLPYVEGRAFYTNFRKFVVSTNEETKPPVK